MAVVTMPVGNDGLPRLPQLPLMWQTVVTGVVILAAVIAVARMATPAETTRPAAVVPTVPKAGAIAHWNAGEQGANGARHVGYVERVNPDGSVVVSEFDWTVAYGYSQRDGIRAPRYIHIQDR